MEEQQLNHPLSRRGRGGRGIKFPLIQGGLRGVKGVPDKCDEVELMVSQKVEKVCHFERQREIFLLNQLVLLRFLPLVEMTIGQFGLFARPSELTPMNGISALTRK
jgi:hypothetical protein